MNFDSGLMESLSALAFLCVGLIFGSFTTVLVYRIPREIPLGLFSHTRSQCTSCKTTIPWFRNIPVFSYLWQRGRCAHCQEKIPVQYPLIELSTGALFLITFLIYQHSPQRPTETLAYWAELIKLLAFDVALIATVFIDLEFRIIPDRFSLGGWVIAVLAAFLWGRPEFINSLLGGAVGAGMFFLMAWFYEKWKGIEGLGLGDVKMMGWLGSWVGFLGVPFVILCASLTGLAAGLIAMRKGGEGFKTAIPFGPFLALGGYLAWAIGALGYW